MEIVEWVAKARAEAVEAEARQIRTAAGAGRPARAAALEEMEEQVEWAALAAGS